MNPASLLIKQLFERLQIMENYEKLTLDLIGEGLTPKARYERIQFLLNVYKNFIRAKETLEFDLDVLGFENQEKHQEAEKIYNILIGKTT